MSDGIPGDPDTYTTGGIGWVCFHCGEHFPGTFQGQRDAADHFGAPYIDSIPACRLRMRAGEKSLLRRIRWLEHQLRELTTRVGEEDTDKDRQIMRMQCEHGQALIREEEKGYARGLRDAVEIGIGGAAMSPIKPPEAELDRARAALRERYRANGGRLTGCTSYVQRILRISYGHAADLLDALETERFITAVDCNKERRQGVKWS
jgi:hypothetical protein